MYQKTLIISVAVFFLHRMSGQSFFWNPTTHESGFCKFSFETHMTSSRYCWIVQLTALFLALWIAGGFVQPSWYYIFLSFQVLTDASCDLSFQLLTLSSLCLTGPYSLLGPYLALPGLTGPYYRPIIFLFCERTDWNSWWSLITWLFFLSFFSSIFYKFLPSC